MKRLIVLLLAAVLAVTGFAASGETPKKADPDIVAYEALDILSVLLMCPNLKSFEGIPSPEVAAEAVAAYKLTGDLEDLSDSEIYRTVFAEGEYSPFSGNSDPELLAVEIEIDSAVDIGDGTVKVSLTVNADYGDGYEFYCLADVYLVPDAQAPCGSRITRVFFPE